MEIFKYLSKIDIISSANSCNSYVHMCVCTDHIPTYTLCVYIWMDRWMDGWMDVRVGGCVDV
jgi:hypothetical protein